MNAVKLIARLTARVQKYAKGIGGPEISTEDIMLAFSLLPEPAKLFVWAKWFDEEDAKQELLKLLVYETELQARGARWRIPDKTRLEAVCKTAIFEAVYPRLCGDCAGRGWVWVEKQSRGRRKNGVAKPLKCVCHECKGNQIVEYSERWHYTMSGVNRRVWTHWARGYRGVIMPVLKEWENQFHNGVLALIKPHINP